ncbi:HD domain-containing protein [Cytobacillus firmus]|nr:HD domain-containing protein [Cytobacillus firmus]
MEDLMNRLKDHHLITYQHSIRVAKLSFEIAKQIIGLNLQDIYFGGLLHDIGKLKIDNKVLNKEGKLNEDEWKSMKQLPIIGYRLVQSLEVKSKIPYMILFHHERNDCSGYPFGLKADEIPVEAQIIAVADTYDAIISRRSNKPSYPMEQALDVLDRGKGSLFTPKIVDALIHVLSCSLVKV